MVDENFSGLKNVSSKSQPNDEHSEYRSGRFSVGFHLLLPVAGLTLLLLGKTHLLTKLLLHLDRNCVSVFCPSLSKREKLLKWACGKLPMTWSSKTVPTLSGGIADLWKDGSLLCTLLNTAIPGACPNPHRHWNQPPAHAQAIAYKYLGVIPIFTDEDLSGSMTSNLECSFINYLNNIQEAIDEISEGRETDRPVTSQYVARGMGLFSGEQHKKAIFYIYLADEESNSSSVIVHIKGPYSTYGQATVSLQGESLKVPEIDVISDQVQPAQLLKPEPKKDFLKNFTKYFKKYHQKHLGEIIAIDVVIEGDKAKVTYLPKYFGMYEIIMITNGELLQGCPFNVHIFKNDSIEDISISKDEDEKIKPHQKKRVISKTIDFIDEEISLTEFEKKYQTPEPVAEVTKIPESPKFNFIEVVEEITKNNEEFKHILDLDQDISATETSLIEELHEPSDGSPFNPEDDTSSKLIVKESGCISSLQVGTTNYFEVEEVDNHNNVINYNVEIQMPVIKNSNFGNEDETHSEQKSKFYSHFRGEEGSSDETLENIAKNEKDLFHVEQHSKNHLCYLQKDNFYETVRNSPSDVLENENGSEVCDGQHHKNYRNLPLDAIEEDEHCTSGSDNENTLSNCEQQSTKYTDLSLHADMSCNVNCNNDISSKHEIVIGYNSKVNNQAVVSMFTNRTVNNPEKKFALDNEKPSPRVGSKYMNNTVNRIKIPEKFVESPKTIVKNNLENKYFSQKISNTEREDAITSTKDNVKYTILRQSNINNKVGVTQQQEAEAIPSRFFQPQKIPIQNQPPLYENTSPICPDHIVPEVEYMELSVADRRKIFAQYSKDSVNSSKNSSFSETENTDGSRSESHYENLSVLNVIDALKQSDSSSINESYSLSSAKSLPDMSLESDDSLCDSVRDRRNFWENISRSSSSISLISMKRVKNKLEEGERCKLIWKKPAESITKVEEVTNNNIPEIYKSADDILSMTESLSYQNSKNYKSLDNSLNDEEMLSIDERKKMLLKQNYELERLEREKLRSLKKKSVMVYDSKNINKVAEAVKVETCFSPIWEKIKKYNSALTLMTVEENNNSVVVPKTDSSKPNNLENIHQKDLTELPEIPKRRIKSQFKRAIRYFQKLEEKSLGKTKPKNPRKAKHFTLDITKKHKNKSRGGSLNLSNISDRFSVYNLYEDVVGNKKGSFKGTPNRSALVEALATFSRKENSLQDCNESEDDINYEIFKNSIKQKKRRSLKSIFDVNY
ncbi:uncharacterized protein isoform X1 [Leptinotarsa decemlineata]|uniref:uncharacterized protein isoform X1 n=1 Tax=Leptinotarsa decemlineata TaxID=7539 RepID=UPI003D30C40C